MWVRMLYSCVVDADFLDTERFFDPEKAATREGHHPKRLAWFLADSRETSFKACPYKKPLPFLLIG
jgi:hypothetical protein